MARLKVELPIEERTEIGLSNLRLTSACGERLDLVDRVDCGFDVGLLLAGEAARLEALERRTRNRGARPALSSVATQQGLE